MKINILQYNIYSTPLDNMFHNRMKETFQRIKIFDTFLAKMRKRVDIISLNESHGLTNTKKLLKKIRHRGFKYNTNIIGDSNNISTAKDIQKESRRFFSLGMVNGGVIIISKFPIIFEREHIFQNCQNFLHSPSSASADCLARKGCLYAKIKKGGSYVNVIGTHLQAWPGKKFDQIRIKQIKEIKIFIKKLQNEHLIKKDEPLIFLGDLNIDFFRYERTLERICKILQVKLPTLMGNRIFTSDPTTNYLVGTSGEAKGTEKKLLKKCRSENCLKTKKIGKYRCKQNPWKNRKTRKNRLLHSFKKSILTIFKKNPPTEKCACISCPPEFLDYITYSVKQKQPTYSSIEIIDPKKIYHSSKEISDHYPILGQFQFNK